MRTYHFNTVQGARNAGVRGERLEALIGQIALHRQSVDARRAAGKRVRKAARVARRAGRA
jgi:hypothetical protein